MLEKVALTIDLVDEETSDCFGATCHPIPHPEDESTAKTEVAEKAVITRASKPVVSLFIYSSMENMFVLQTIIGSGIIAKNTMKINK